jgi:hypothetical protein
VVVAGVPGRNGSGGACAVGWGLVARTPKAPKPPKQKRPSRRGQIREAYKLSKQHDKNIGLATAAAFVVPLLVIVTIGLLLSSPIIFSILGVMFGLIAAMAVFSRRAQKASYQAVAGTPGVSAAIVERMRGQWIVTPAVQLNRDQDLVHRVIGRCGVVLLAEGRNAGQLVGAEVRRLKKVIGDTPVTVLHVGDAEEQVPLHKLQVRIVKLPRVLAARDVIALDRRLKALPGAGTPLPIPKGPMPTRMPKAARR